MAGDTVVVGQGQGAGAGAIAASVQTLTSTQITAVTGAGAKAGRFNVFVSDPSGTPSPASPGDVFTYAAPTVTSVSPDAGPVSGGTPITIDGTGFGADDSVMISQGQGHPAIPASVQSISPTQILATTGGGARPGRGNVLVLTPGAKSPAAPANRFTYTSR